MVCYVSCYYFSILPGLIECEGPAVDPLLLLWVPFWASISCVTWVILCDLWCSQGHLFCEARWNMKLAQRCSWNGRECQLRNKGNASRIHVRGCILHAKRCFSEWNNGSLLLPTAIIFSLSLFCCPPPFFFPFLSKLVMLMFLIWYIVDPLKGSLGAQTHPPLPALTHTHKHNQICWFLSIKPRQLFASC